MREHLWGSNDLNQSDTAALLQRQMQVLELVATAAPVPVALNAILVALEDLIPGAQCSILIMDSAGSALRHGAAPSLPTGYLSAIDGLEPGPQAGSCGTAAFLGQPVVAEDIRADDRWRHYRTAALQHGLLSCWSSPIFSSSGRTVGTFAVYHGYTHSPTQRERRLVTWFTNLASVAIEHGGLLGQLIESEDLFRRTFEDNPGGEALLDLERRFEQVNTAFAQLSGYRPGELVGAQLEAALLFDAATERRIHTTLASDGSHCVTEQMQLKCKDGHVKLVDATFSLIRGRDGVPTRLALNLVDLTERMAIDAARSARHAAEVARHTAEEHSNAKSQLLTSVSHEVRTPLQAIKGFAELLSTLDLDESRRKEALGRINFAADHLLDLVTDVLDISRVEAGALPLTIEPIFVRQIVLDVVQLLEELASERHVTIKVQINPDLELLADRGRLCQVLLNVIGNAVRHGRRSGAIEIVAVRDDSAVTISVADDGPGIPISYLPRMFTPFARPLESESPTNPVDGYGLGLVLSFNLIAAMNGNLTAENGRIKGAIFGITLPYVNNK